MTVKTAVDGTALALSTRQRFGDLNIRTEYAGEVG